MQNIEYNMSTKKIYIALNYELELQNVKFMINNIDRKILLKYQKDLLFNTVFYKVIFDCVIKA